MKQYFKINQIEYVLGSQKLNSFELGKEFITNDNPKEKINLFIENVIGKDTVYRLSEKDNLIDMAVQVVKKAIDKAKINKIDAIICTNVVGEYYTPTTALVILDKAGLNKDVRFATDMNTNCTGMITALYTINSMMGVDDSINNVLVVDMMTLSHFKSPIDLLANVGFSDAVTAMVVSRRDVPLEMEFMGYQDTTFINTVMGPANGMVNLANDKDINKLPMNCKTPPRVPIEKAVEITNLFLDKHNLQPSDIKHNCFSQVVKSAIYELSNQVGFKEDTVEYIGDKLGYTGPSSPILALKNRIDRGLVKDGDQIFVWAISTGVQFVFCLFKY